MPHYQDGTEAKIGDIVRGKPYNTPHEVIGPIVSITPSQEVCNCQVAFAKVIGLPEVYSGHYTVIRNADGNMVYLQAVTDYGETRAFTKIA